MTTPDKTLRIGPFSGLDNRTERTRLKAATRDDPRYALFDATNVDITKDGNIKSRPGRELMKSGVTTALWHQGDEVCYIVQDGTLYEIDEGFGFVPIAEVGGSPCCFAHEHGTSYFGTADFTGEIVGGQLSMLGIPQPSAPIAISATAAGGLYAGRYGVAISFVADNGRESGMGEPARIELAQPGGIHISGLPANGLRLNVYATQANSETFWRVATLEAGTAGFFLSSVHSGLPAQNVGMYPAPVGAIDMALYRGRLYLAIGEVVPYSEPLTYGWWSPKNYLKPPSAAVHLLPVRDGLYIACANNLVFLEGSGPEDFRQAMVQRCATVAGTKADLGGMGIGTNGLARWAVLTDRGVLYLYDGGQAVNQTQDHLDLPRALRGGGVLRDYGGEQHYLASLQPRDAAGFRENWTIEITNNGLPVKD